MQFYFRSSSRGRRPAPGEDQPVLVNGLQRWTERFADEFLTVVWNWLSNRRTFNSQPAVLMLKMCLHYCTVFLVACAFAKLNISFVMSACLSVRPPLCMELGSYLKGLSWNLALEKNVLISVRKIQVSFKLDNQTVLYIKTFSHLWHLAEFFLKLYFSQHFRENQNIHFMFINFPRIVPSVAKVPDRPLTIWRMRSVCWMHARTHARTHLLLSHSSHGYVKVAHVPLYVQF